MSEYSEFLISKIPVVHDGGRLVSDESVHPRLFDWQRAIVRWAVRKGRCAVFAGTGLGKTLMQLECARQTGRRTLFLAPLAVARQTVREAMLIGIELKYARSESEAEGSQYVITNYDMLHEFDLSLYGCVVLDESSILKSFESKTRSLLIQVCAAVPYRFCFTATPAPNDITEIANHAEFLGLMTREEMLAAFFVHDDDGWRLKGHASAGPFWRWLASWSMSIRKPSDLGYSDDGYILPPLTVHPMFVECEYIPDGQLFATTPKGIGDRSRVRKSTLQDRVNAAVEIVQRDTGGQWLIWCGLNDESAAMAAALPGAIEVQGSDSHAHKANILGLFADGDVPILVTKPAIAGFGLNLQTCSRMVFVGLNDSWETYYQAIRRCWRFGQQFPVTVYVVLSDIERVIWDNVQRKEREAETLSENLVQHVSQWERQEIHQQSQMVDYQPAVHMMIPDWLQGVTG